MTLKEIGALFALASLWGASFLFMRIAAPVIGPLFTIQGRLTIAAVTLLIFIWIGKRSVYFKRWWKEYLIVGAINCAIPFTLIATAELSLNASMSAIINSLTPLFTALVVWGWMKEKLTVRKLIGIIIGILGVFILVGWSPMPMTRETILSVILITLASIAYSFGGVYVKKTFQGIPPLSLATGQQIGAMIFLLPFTLLFLPYSKTTTSSVVIFSVLGLAIFCTAIAYLLYFYLMENVGPTKTISVTFLVPLFGMIWGALFLHEHITVSMVIGLTVILSSIFLISDISLQSTLKKSNKLVG